MRRKTIWFLVLPFFLVGFTYLPWGTVIESWLSIKKANINYIFWISLWSSFYSAIFFTFLIFFINEYVLNDPNLSGEWLIEETNFLSTSYAGYTIYYKCHLLQKGQEFEGFAEKTFQITNENKFIEFLPNANAIIRSSIKGSITKNYIKRSKINLMQYEIGRKRETTSIATLSFINKNTLRGYFFSSASSSSGIIVMKRKTFPKI